MYDCIIVGAGISGLTSAIYLRRASKKVLILEAKSYGGQIVNASRIDNYPGLAHISGFDFATQVYNQAIDLGAEIKFEKVIDIKDGDVKEVITSNNSYKSKTIILATGSDNRKLGLDGENELLGKGLSYCATCDGAFYKNKVVAVVGGGDNAIEDALYLSDIVSKLYLIHRREEFKAEEKLINELKEKNNIEYMLNSSITKLNYDEKLDSIEVISNGEREKEIKVDGLFVAVGRIPENQNFAKLINLDNNGYVITDENCHTNVAGIFASGDNRVKNVRQLVTAASDGAVSATEVIKYISNR